MENRIPENAKIVQISPYNGTTHECCCGDPNCREFEDRMTAWGIPVEELSTVTFIQELEGTP